jgi:RimJ/RimL family protein N-acetyltransferase
MTWPAPITLAGPHVRLEPLSHAHHDDLVEAVQDGRLWELWYTPIASPDTMAQDIERRLGLQAKGTMLPFAVLDPHSGRAIGMTTYLNIEAEHRRLEIGATWYRKSHQRTPLNTDAKRLLLQHAFESLGAIAVELRTSCYNFQSRKAIERIGAKLDGVLRAHRMGPEGRIRDTYVYSVIAQEWPSVKTHLHYLLDVPIPNGPSCRP